MSWWEVLIAIPVLSGIGAMSAVLCYRALERRRGVIEQQEGEFHEIAKALGVDPEEARSMGLQCAAYGLKPDELQQLVRRWNRGE